MELDYISTQLLNDIIKMTSLISPVIEIMKNDMILSKASPHFVDSYQQFKDVLIKTKKNNRISEDNLDIIIIFFNNLRSLYYNININIDNQKNRQAYKSVINNYLKICKYWAILSRFTVIIGIFILKYYKLFHKEIDNLTLNEFLRNTLILINEKETIKINQIMIHRIPNEEFGQVSSLVTPLEGKYDYKSILFFNAVFGNLDGIYEELGESLDDIKRYVIDYFNAKLESINANIKIIIGKEIIDTNELEKNLQEFSDIANEEKFKEILSLLSLYNKVDKNKNDILTLLTIFEKIKKEYHTDTNFIKDIDEIIENFKSVLKVNKEIYIYELYILLKTKYKLIELYNEYKEKRFLDNDLESLTKPIDEYIDIYEKEYFAFVNKYKENKLEPLIKQEIDSQKLQEVIDREKSKEIIVKKDIILPSSRNFRMKKFFYFLNLIKTNDKAEIKNTIKEIIKKVNISLTDLSFFIRQYYGEVTSEISDILKEIYEESYIKNGGSKKSKRVLKRLH